MMIGFLRIFAIISVAFVCGKFISKLKLPAILGWLIAGVMIGREIIFKKIASSGKQIIGITFVQSIGTFLFVSAAFSVVFFIHLISITC